MTAKQEKLIENYVRTKVRSMLKEATIKVGGNTITAEGGVITFKNGSNQISFEFHELWKVSDWSKNQ